MTFEEYLVKVFETRAEQPSWRAGQTFFNVLYNERNDLASAVRSTDIDPYYDNDRIPEFLSFICERW